MTALVRVLLAHVLADALLWPARHEADFWVRNLLRTAVLWLSASLYALMAVAATLPDRHRAWPAVAVGAVALALVRVAVLLGQARAARIQVPLGSGSMSLRLVAPSLPRWGAWTGVYATQLGALVLLVWWLTGVVPAPRLLHDPARVSAFWTLAAAYAIAVWPAGSVVALLTNRWQADMELSGPLAGLPGGGMWIGRLERALVISFVLAGRLDAIGGLVIAKGFIRYGEIKEATHRKLAEYIFIGSMASFGLALVLGWAARRLLGW